MIDTITNYNDRNNIPLSNANIRESINQVILEEQAKADNITVDTFSTHRNKGEYLIDKVANLTINDVRNDMIEKVANLTITDVKNNLMNKVANLPINNIRRDSNRATVSDVQVQFTGNSAIIFHQNLLSRRMIGIINYEVPMLFSPMESIIIANNKPSMTVRTVFIQVPQALKTPVMQEFITVTTPYNMGAKRAPCIVFRTGVDGSTPADS